MFEDSLLDSARSTSRRSRWPAIVSFAVQAFVLAVIVVVPLLHPERVAMAAPLLTLIDPPVPPPPPMPHPPVHVHVEEIEHATTAPSAPSAPPHPSLAQARINTHPTGLAPEDAPSNFFTNGNSMTANSSIPNFGGNSTATGTAITVATPAPPRRVTLSTGVSAGLLLGAIRPAYPPIARAAHIEGTVIIHAVISKTGIIEGATATSGPQMLYGAAIDAVRAARYKPFLLNGEPVEVDTTITINFRLSS